MLAKLLIQRHHRGHKGQSLVETAIFLPILLIILAGIVEVSNLLLTQNRVQTAARAATGYGAANFKDEEWQDPNVWAIPMANVAMNNVTNTLDLDTGRWDIWTVKATLNPSASAFEEWNPYHALGTGNVVSGDEWSVMESQIMTDVLDALSENEEGLEVVATVAFHDRESLLGLNAFNVGPITRIRGLSVMRVSDPVPYTACDAFPIAINVTNFSLYPADTDPGIGEPVQYPPFEEFPFRTDERYPSNDTMWWIHKDEGKPPPVYEDGNTEQFPYNVPGVSITDAQPGYLYLGKQAAENDMPGAFGWLRWRQESSGGSATDLEASLRYPGNAYTYNWQPWAADGLSRFDIVGVSTGAVASAKDEMIENTEYFGRTLKLPVFTPPSVRDGDWNGDGYGTGGSGNNTQYEVYGFVVVKLLGWYLPGNHNWLLFEFIRWDNSCP